MLATVSRSLLKPIFHHLIAILEEIGLLRRLGRGSVVADDGRVAGGPLVPL